MDGRNHAASPVPLVRDLGFTEGPVDLRDGSVAFTSMTRGEIVRHGDESVTVLASTGAGPTGLALLDDGALLIAQNSGFWDAPSDGPAGLAILRDGVATMLRTDVGAPNDLCIGPDGLVYFTDPVSPDALTSAVPGNVYAYSLERDVVTSLTTTLLFPNGLAFDESGQRLFVAESFSRKIHVLTVDDGKLLDMQPWADVDGGLPDGICIDQDGRLYAAVGATDSVHVYDADGREVDRIHCGEGAYPSNCCFAGPDLSLLVVTVAGIGGVVQLDVGARGLPLYPFR